MPLAAQVEISRQRDGDDVGRQRYAAAARRSTGNLNQLSFQIDVGNIQRHQLADANTGGEEQLQDQIVANGAEVPIASSRGVIARNCQLGDLILRRCQK